MRPIRLEMTAFGPYREKTVLNFRDFNNHRLFLVSGPTGAGKTTIFDAIAYALYDDASGDGRNRDSFKSDFATDEDFCEVVFTFELNGKEYKIERSPAQKGPGKRGSKNYPSSVTFYHDGKVTTRIKDANQEIEQLLSLTYAQFKQIVMLPQGEFKKLLESDSSEKEKIFRNIFRTESILAFQESLKKKSATLRKDAEQAKSELTGSMRFLASLADAPLEEAQKLEEYDTMLDRLLALLEQYQSKSQELQTQKKHFTAEVKKMEQCKADFVRYRQLLAEQKELEQKQEYYTGLAQQIQRFDQAKNCLDAKTTWQSEQEAVDLLKERQVGEREKLKDLLEEKQEKAAAFQHLEENYQKLPQWRETERQLQSQIEKFNQLQKLEMEYKSSAEKQQKIKAELIQLEKSLQQNQTEQQQNQTVLEKVLLEQQELAAQKEKQNELQNDVYQFEQLAKKFRQMEILIQNLSDMEAKMSHSQEVFQKQSMLLMHQRTLYHQNIAGVLAEELALGTPCFVCGSTEHPQLAEQVAGAPSKENLESLQLSYNEAQQTFSDDSAAVKNIRKQLLALEQELDVTSNQLETQNESLQKNLQQKEEALSETLQIIRKLEESVLQLPDYQKQQTDLLQTEKGLEIQQTKFLTEQKNCAEMMEQLTETMKQLKNDIGELHLASLEMELSALSSKIQATEIDYPKEKEKIDQLETATAVQRRTLESLDEQIQTAIKRAEEATANFHLKLEEAQLTEDFEAGLLEKAAAEKARKELQSYQDAVRINEINRSEQEQTLAQHPKELDEEEAQAQLQQAEESLRIIEEEWSKVQIDLDTVQKGHASIKETYERLKDTLHRYQSIQRLAEIANGNSKETGRMSFERYVLAIYYEEIVRAANIRLQQMTADRYLLVRAEEPGKGAGAKGLELDVFDHFTGQCRSVKTLSGGEGFKASLALALGLSDVMQQQSGGTQIDTLFIDEGFGTLDPFSLDAAIQTLVELNARGRMIGVISHVEELKNRIPAHIKVTHTNKGSQALIEV